MADTTASPWQPALTALARLAGDSHPSETAAALIDDHGEPGNVDETIAVLIDLTAHSLSSELEDAVSRLLVEYAPTCRRCGRQTTPLGLTGGWHCTIQDCPDATEEEGTPL